MANPVPLVPSTIRCGVVICPIWAEFHEYGDFHILIHYRRSAAGEPILTAAYSRYNGVLTDISEKMRTLKLVPDWRQFVTR